MKLTAFNGTSIKVKETKNSLLSESINRTIEENMNNSYIISADSELNHSFDRGCAGLVRMNLLVDQAKMLTDGPKVVSAFSNEKRNKGLSCNNLI